MIHYGTKLNQSTYSLVQQGPVRLFENDKYQFDNTQKSQSLNQPNNADSFISRFQKNTQSRFATPNHNQSTTIKVDQSTLNMLTQNKDKANTHQYLVKKYGNNILGDQAFNIDELFRQINDIFCIVCEQYISEQKIDQHCRVCQAKPQDEVEQIGSLQSKLEKCNYLISRVKKLLKIYCLDKQQVIQYLQLLWKCVSEIILATSENTIIALSSDLDLFIEFFNNQKGDEQEERLLLQIMTIISKIAQFTERKTTLVQKHKVQDFLRESLASSVAQNRHPLNDIQNQSKIFSTKQVKQSTYNNDPISHRQIIKINQDESHNHIEVVPEVSSCGSSRIVQGDDFLTNVFKFGSQKPGDFQLMERQSVARSIFHNDQISRTIVGGTQDHDKLNKSNNGSYIGPQSNKTQGMSIVRTLNGQERIISQDKKTLFFNLATQIKENYTLEHPAQTVLVAGLYERANKTGINPSDYEKFIMDYYHQV